MVMIKLKFIVNVVVRMGAIWIKSGAFNETLEATSKKEKLPHMKVSDILHGKPIDILKDAFKM